ncbi:unnamed protein product [Phytophthora fragariaefolia]|uniref:Unnamed protein product n=1 Tax=Phytophthora fragariaefolia TaxID=1490495 RepID=A0A9W6XHY7_9STRA|nr:unnamed protein product [Phytophthora fragariaefolia]
MRCEACCPSGQVPGVAGSRASSWWCARELPNAGRWPAATAGSAALAVTAAAAAAAGRTMRATLLTRMSQSQAGDFWAVAVARGGQVVSAAARSSCGLDVVSTPLAMLLVEREAAETAASRHQLPVTAPDSNTRQQQQLQQRLQQLSMQLHPFLKCATQVSSPPPIFITTFASSILQLHPFYSSSRFYNSNHSTAPVDSTSPR